MKDDSMNTPDFSRLGWTTYKPAEPEITDFTEALIVIAYIKSRL